ncbi:uncharacterized protein LOC134181535 [Corticium candelabrum]|uniref:uncharacterized protein LOC134181535 n=1 Tax=Corticium candelabrum TaxID=121492 RepID=UPI002E276361|nr:uncharacterized protein LOC134181535 [Corticium candelabrum]
MDQSHSTSVISFFSDLSRTDLNDTLKAHFSLTNRLSETMSEFASKLGSSYEKFSSELKMLVKSFRRKNDELKKERHLGQGNFFSIWEAMMMEIEGEASAYTELASSLQQTVAQPLAEFTSKKRAQYKKLFAYREQIEGTLVKSEEGLQKRHREYAEAWTKYKAQDKDTLKECAIILGAVFLMCLCFMGPLPLALLFSTLALSLAM